MTGSLGWLFWLEGHQVSCLQCLFRDYPVLHVLFVAIHFAYPAWLTFLLNQPQKFCKALNYGFRIGCFTLHHLCEKSSSHLTFHMEDLGVRKSRWLRVAAGINCAVFLFLSRGEQEGGGGGSHYNRDSSHGHCGHRGIRADSSRSP